VDDEMGMKLIFAGRTYQMEDKLDMDDPEILMS